MSEKKKMSVWVSGESEKKMWWMKEGKSVCEWGEVELKKGRKKCVEKKSERVKKKKKYV